MAIDEPYSVNAPEEEHNTEEAEETVPIGIARIRKEWRAAGLVEKETSALPQEDDEAVIFPEIDGGAGIGDYVLDAEIVRTRLGLSRPAIDRIVGSGELDSVLVQGPDGTPRRLFSESSVARFEVDSGIDPDAVKQAAKAFADKGVAEAIDEMRVEITEIQNTQGKVLQQMKDMLLLEIRNLKEQDRDLTSFVYELAEEIRQALPKKKKR